MASTKLTATAVPYGPRIDPNGKTCQDFLVMVGHAGRGAQTGMKVHTAEMRMWEDGSYRVEAASCSGNGHLHGTLVMTQGYDFSRVTCKICGGRTPEIATQVATRRNAKAIQVELSRSGVQS